MSYGNKTRFYEIPYMKNGDMLSQQSQKKQMTIIDNLLFASNFGASKCLIEQGDYYLQKTQNGCIVKLKPYTAYSVLGILNHRLFMSEKQIQTPQMFKGQHYYIYFVYKQALQEDAQSFKFDWYLEEQGDFNTLIKSCQVDYTGQQPILITDLNKVYAKNVLAHTQDKTNPHGQDIIQKNLKIQNELILNDNKIYPVIYEKLQTKGTEGIVWNKEGYKPIFATIYGEYSIGQVYWQIIDNDLIIFNTGQINKNINVKIEVDKI